MVLCSPQQHPIIGKAVVMDSLSNQLGVCQSDGKHCFLQFGCDELMSFPISLLASLTVASDSRCLSILKMASTNANAANATLGLM